MIIISFIPKSIINPALLLIVLIVAAIIGYRLIKQVPRLLHTPLMSGMNALSGITVLGALTVFAVLFKDHHPLLAYVFGGLTIILSTINVVAGFGVTERMLRMFHTKEERR